MMGGGNLCYTTAPDVSQAHEYDHAEFLGWESDEEAGLGGGIFGTF